MRDAREWELFAQKDPYYAILTHDKFKRKNFTAQSKKDFFVSGENHLQNVFRTINEFVDVDFKPKHALDFGCGIGRITIPLSYRVKNVVGADISPTMLKKARKNSIQTKKSSIKYCFLKDVLQKKERFSFIHSFLVFQHIPYRKGMRIFSQLLDMLEEDGVFFVHFFYRLPLHSKISRWIKKNVFFVETVMKLVRGVPLSYPRMCMYGYPLKNVQTTIQRKGCKIVCADFLSHEEVFLFIKK